MRTLAFVAAGSLLLAGCQSVPVVGPGSRAYEQTLTLIVADLQMHLRDDTYRAFRVRAASGRDVFQHALGRLDRLQSQRAVPQDAWGNVDLVIEYARGRALERSRRYLEAGAAYERVATAGSILRDPAEQAGEVMRLFAEHSSPPPEFADAVEEGAWLSARVEHWNQLAWDHRGTPYRSLALEESEAWARLRVDGLLRERGVDAAVEGVHRLLERHRTSKLYARHLIRMGDLYAEAARREHLRSRVNQAPFDAARYDGFLDHAFSAYELAAEERAPALRTEAAKKIEALLASHRRVVSDVP